MSRPATPTSLEDAPRSTTPNTTSVEPALAATPAADSQQAEERPEPEAQIPVESHDPAAPSRTARSSRSQEATLSRRTSRRASLDPYPAQTESVSEHSRRSARTRARSTQPHPDGDSRDHLLQVEERETAGNAQESTASDATSAAVHGKHFELVVLQQPEIGAEAGLGKVTLGRLPIVPAPVVQVIVRDDSGQILDLELPYLFCSCSLRDAEGITPLDITPSGSTSQENGEISALIGSSVRNPHRIRDLDGNSVSVFVFEDISVRVQGSFSLEFTLGEARQPKSPKLATVGSEPFDVVEWKNYPGRPAADTVPELSMHLHKQGVPMYIPPLVLTAPASSPPPPSTNPFPIEHLTPGDPDSGDPDETATPRP